jgi:hypothetical protein
VSNNNNNSNSARRLRSWPIMKGTTAVVDVADGDVELIVKKPGLRAMLKLTNFGRTSLARKRAGGLAGEVAHPFFWTARSLGEG